MSEGDAPIGRARAERIARAHACTRCGEYSYRKIRVRPADEATATALKVRWHAALECGVCGTSQELGLDEDGDVVYVG